MDTNNLKAFATYIVNDLLTAGVLAQDTGGSWKLKAPVFGYQQDIEFRDKQDMIERVAGQILTRYGTHSGLKVAV